MTLTRPDLHATTSSQEDPGLFPRRTRYLAVASTLLVTALAAACGDANQSGSESDVATCFFNATVTGARNGTFEGPARFSFAGSGLSATGIAAPLGIELGNFQIVDMEDDSPEQLVVTIHLGVEGVTEAAPGLHELQGATMGVVSKDVTKGWSAFFTYPSDPWTGSLQIQEMTDDYVVGHATATMPEVTDDGLAAVNLEVSFRAVRGSALVYDAGAPFWQCVGSWLEG